MGVLELERILEEYHEVTADDFNTHLDLEGFIELTQSTKGLKYNLKLQHAKYFSQGEISIELIKKYLEIKGVSHLGLVTGKVDNALSEFYNLSEGLGTITGLWKGRKANKEVRQTLVKIGIIEGDLQSLGNDAEEIFKYILKNPLGSALDYFDSDVVGQYAVSNRKLFFKSRAIAEYFSENGITHLGHVTGRDEGGASIFSDLSIRIGRVTDLWKGEKSNQEVRRALVTNGIIDGDLQNYSNKDEIFALIVSNPKSAARDYLNASVVGNKNAVSNKNLFLKSGAIKDYLIEKGIIHLGHITGNVDNVPSAFYCLSHGLGSITDFWKGAKSGSKVRKALVENGIINGNLISYETSVQDEIFKQILFNPQTSALD